MDDLSSQRQVSIEPSVPKSSSISSHIGCREAFAMGFGIWSDLEAGTVGMGAQDFEGSFLGIKVLTYVEGYDGWIISSEEILFSLLEFPIGCLTDFVVAILGELFSAPFNSVEWGSGEVDKFEELISKESASFQELVLHEIWIIRDLDINQLIL